MGMKGDLSDFERGMVVGTKRAGLSISKTEYFHAQLSLGFTEKISSERQLCGRKCLVDVSGEWADWLEMIERHQ